MTPEEKAQEKILLVMREINEQALLVPESDAKPLRSNGVYYHKIKGVEVWFGQGRDLREVRNIIYLLKEKGAIEILDELHNPDGESASRYTLKLAPEFEAVYAEYDSLSKQKTPSKVNHPSFRVHQGVLYRDGCDVVEVFKEDSHEYTALRASLVAPIGDRIDKMSELVDIEWKPLCDAARRVNEKVERRFHVKNFFSIDYKNQAIVRNVD